MKTSKIDSADTGLRTLLMLSGFTADSFWLCGYKVLQDGITSVVALD